MLSAVVVTYESEAVVGDCLASLRRWLPEAEIIVVDNASRDATRNIVGERFPEARLIALPTNVGFGRACNAGAGVATRKHLLFVNPDVRVDHVDGEKLEALLAEEPFGLVGPALDGKEVRRRERSWVRDLLHHGIGPLRPRELRPGVAGTRSDHSWVSGAMLLAAADEFQDLGGFDTRFFLYYEDRDLSRRYRRAGLPIRTTTAISGTHAGGASSAIPSLRIEPMAWSYLSWLEYLAIHEGERTARVAAATSGRLLKGSRRALAAVPGARAARKRRQLEEMLRFVADRTRSGGEFCPNAVRTLRSSAPSVPPRSGETA